MKSDSVKWLVVHTAAAATEDGRIFWPTASDVDRWHGEKGWSMIGYHFFVEGDGTEIIGRPETRCGAHVRGLNDISLGVCVSGHGDLAPFNIVQNDTLIRILVRELRERGLDEKAVIGHREVCEIANAPPPNKTCPGVRVSMDGIRRMVHFALKDMKLPAPDENSRAAGIRRKSRDSF